jgi:hypothetical protein
MNTAIVFVVGVVVALVFAYWFCIKYQGPITKFSAGSKWRDLVLDNAAVHLPIQRSWRNPDGKTAFIAALWGDKIPTYLFYALGSKNPTEEEKLEISKQLWGLGERNFGDLQILPPTEEKIGFKLSARHVYHVLSEITISGKKFPLYQIGCPPQEEFVFLPNLYGF